MRILILFLFIPIFVVSLAFKTETINNFPLVGKIIAIDPGHGGEDPGSVYKDEYEKDYNLAFSKTLSYELEKNGATVILTRAGDYDLSIPNSSSRKRTDFDNRIKLINESSADVYLSIHMNYLNDSSYFGAQTFYTKNEKNLMLANILQENFNSFFNFNKDAKEIGNDKYMYKRLKVTGVLVEYGFMSNENDRENLKKENYKYDLANVIVDAIIKYFT